MTGERIPAGERLAVAAVGTTLVAVPTVHATAVVVGGAGSFEPLPVAVITLGTGAVTSFVLTTPWGRRGRRPLAVAAAAACLAGLLVVGLGSGPAAAALGLLAAVPLYGLALPALARHLPVRLEGAWRRRRLRASAWSLLALLAVAQLVRLSCFMVDPSSSWGAAFPFDPGSVQHMCLAAYVRAAEIARSVPARVYDPALYESGRGALETSVSHLGPYLEDRYLYPPPFLLLPMVALELTGEFLSIRTVWFALQVLGFSLAGLFLARWIGGRPGLLAGLLLPALWASIPFLFALQYGQFHLPALALAVVGMIALEQRRLATGGGALAAAVLAKISPGVLLGELVGRRRPRALLATGAAGAVLAVAALAILGPAPYREYLGGRLLEITGAEAGFTHSSLLSLANDVSLISAMVKLGELGVEGMSVAVASAASWVYTLAVAALAVVVGLRSRAVDASTPEGRLWRAGGWLALINLTVLRSPSAPGVYVLTGSLWLLTLLLAEEGLSRWRVALLVTAWVLFLGVPPLPGKGALLAMSLLVQGLCLGLNAWVVLRRPPLAATVAPGERARTVAEVA